MCRICDRSVCVIAVGTRIRHTSSFLDVIHVDVCRWHKYSCVECTYSLSSQFSGSFCRSSLSLSLSPSVEHLRGVYSLFIFIFSIFWQVNASNVRVRAQWQIFLVALLKEIRKERQTGREEESEPYVIRIQQTHIRLVNSQDFLVEMNYVAFDCILWSSCNYFISILRRTYTGRSHCVPLVRVCVRAYMLQSPIAKTHQAIEERERVCGCVRERKSESVRRRRVLTAGSAWIVL